MTNPLEFINNVLTSNPVKVIGDTLDKITTTDDERQKNVLAEKALDQNTSLKRDETSSKIIISEAQGEGWLQKNWRPLIMLEFSSILTAMCFGWTKDVPIEIQLALIDVVSIGIGGYMVGRSAEKIATIVKGFKK